MNALLFGTTGAAVALLALGMPRHYKHVFHKNLPERKRRGLRISGGLFLVVSLLAALAGWQGGVSLVSWIALLAFQGLAIGMLLAYRPKWVPGLTVLFALISLVFAIMAPAG